MRSPVLKACGVDIDALRRDLANLHRQRARRASSPRRRASRCRPRASSASSSAPPCTCSRRAARRSPAPTCWWRMFSERDSHAGLFPREAGHDAARRRRLHQPRHGQGAGPRAQRAAVTGAEEENGGEKAGSSSGNEALAAYCVDLNQKAARAADRSADRPRARGRAHHPGAVPAPQEQPALCRRARRRQDGDRRGPGAQDRRGRGARRAAGAR